MIKHSQLLRAIHRSKCGCCIHQSHCPTKKPEYCDEYSPILTNVDAAYRWLQDHTYDYELSDYVEQIASTLEKWEEMPEWQDTPIDVYTAAQDIVIPSRYRYSRETALRPKKDPKFYGESEPI